MSEAVSGEALIQVFEAVIGAHQSALEELRVPPDRIAALFTRQLVATIARINSVEARQRVVGQLVAALPRAVEAVAAAQPRAAA